MPIALHPASFACPDHATVDLTQQVKDLVSEDPVTVGSYGMNPLRRRRRQRSFEYVVTCPGLAPVGQPSQPPVPHQVTVTGNFTVD